MHLCSEGRVIKNGLGLIDIRVDITQPSGCEHYLDDCCDVGKTIAPSEIHKPTPPPSNKPVRKNRCGQRNPEGIGYRILEQVSNEAEYG